VHARSTLEPEPSSRLQVLLLTNFFFQQTLDTLRAFTADTARTRTLHQLLARASALIDGLHDLMISDRFTNTNVHNDLEAILS